MVGVLPQHQWSYAGWGGDHVNESNIQYFMQLFLPEMWQVGVGNPTVHIDWTAGGGDKVTFPVGLNVAKMVKVGKTPVKLWLGGYYAPIRPDGYGQDWSVRFQISPTMPALIKGYLLE